jgi:hypothetical protein
VQSVAPEPAYREEKHCTHNLSMQEFALLKNE